MRPASIRKLESFVTRLAVYGGAAVSEETERQFLLDRGIAHPEDAGSVWLYPTLDALTGLFPGESELDLLRKLAIRDPLYRLHLDLTICQTLHAIGTTQRWQRFEQLLLDDCKEIAPRINQLMKFASSILECELLSIHANQWQTVRENCFGPFVEQFRNWDSELWGETKGPSEMFPLLTELYLPISSAPVFWSEKSELVGQLVAASQQGEAIRVSDYQIPDILSLQSAGCPLDFEPGSNTKAFLVGAVETRQTVVDQAEFTGSERLSLSAQKSSFSSMEELVTHSLLPSSLAETPPRCGVFSLQDVSEWKSQDEDSRDPHWLILPPREDFTAVGQLVAESGNVDEALMRLSQHPLYGFLIQIFLIEALDRELGGESIVVGLKQNTKLDDLSAWAESEIFVSEGGQSGISNLVNLGKVDDALDRVGRLAGIRSVVTPTKIELGGPWAAALYLLNQVSLIDDTPDWTLILNPVVFDRLHRGHLMKDVIRGGRSFREQLLEQMKALAVNKELEAATG